MRLPSSSHSSSISIFTLSPFSTLEESHSFCGGALQIEIGKQNTKKSENKTNGYQVRSFWPYKKFLNTAFVNVPAFSRICGAYVLNSGCWCCLCLFGKYGPVFRSRPSSGHFGDRSSRGCGSDCGCCGRHLFIFRLSIQCLFLWNSWFCRRRNFACWCVCFTYRSARSTSTEQRSKWKRDKSKRCLVDAIQMQVFTVDDQTYPIIVVRSWLSERI